MLIINQNSKKFIEDKLNLNVMRSGMHVIQNKNNENQYQHYVYLVWLVELNYFSTICYLSVAHSLEQKEKKISKCLFYIPDYNNKYFLIDVSERNDKIKESLASINLATISNNGLGVSHINLEIYSTHSRSQVSINMSSNDASHIKLKAEIFNLIEWIVSEKKDKQVVNLMKTRVDGDYL